MFSNFLLNFKKFSSKSARRMSNLNILKEKYIYFFADF